MITIVIIIIIYVNHMQWKTRAEDASLENKPKVNMIEDE